jgi:hypothetical protein
MSNPPRPPVNIATNEIERSSQTAPLVAQPEPYAREAVVALRRLTRILALLLPPIAASLISLATPNPAFLGFGFFVLLMVALYAVTFIVMVVTR